MDKINPITMQKQIRDNAEDYASCLRDLRSWESDMKKKESELQEQRVTPDSSTPPVRSRRKKSASSKIHGFDYASWDSFDVDQACADVDADSESETDSETDSEQRARDEAMYEKEKGNRLVKSKKWNEAITCYSRAIECYPHDAIYYANRALCYLKTENFVDANNDCTASLQLDTDYVKAYQRRAAARVGLGQLVQAREDLIKVMELEPMNTASKSELIHVEKLINASKVIQPGVVKHSASPANDGGAPLGKMSWGSEEGVKLVQPIHKPPHLRSKKPMRRIEIVQVNQCTADEQTKVTKVQPSSNSPSEAIARVKVTEESPSSISPSEVIEQVQVTEALEQVPPRPVSSVEFLVGWRKVKSSPELSFQYLNQIPGLDLPNIFQESLEPSTFSDIISVLSTEFVRRGEPVYPYMCGIARVKRLSALTMFMSSSEVTILKKLLSHCVETQQCSSDQAELLRGKYELG